MSTLFIADLHLSEQHPKITETFFSFLDSHTTNIDALYILGDLFEVWIGDDEHTPLMDLVADKLSQYSKQHHIPIYYIHGNRDFMIGKKYANQSSMQLLPEHYVVTLYGQKVLLMHGDTLCLADKNYQKMRKVIHNPILQTIFNLLPLHFRKKIGWKIRTASQSKKVHKKNNIMGVTQDEVERLLLFHRCHTLIHGHTHQVAEHQFKISGESFKRYDVGDWFHNYSYLEVTEQSCQLHISKVD
ncbi:UDP-2,3-diacylglucosamine diphosphatase [Psychromonas sp. psych-6C06]|uniref:UDP-2,3-diacylglucosamine diphosphatase n=1 Tax=Psychromonas sp. psych-6C06 TaxID=2058089 RepID=UPI000C341D56|nr:UDP-2,3-diacylglucosamine diphosphatase [Psychromonas sp. psych-6C06]PKF61076.1 UDP-2,3-diacylglucosamine diphosphatase [Psychromonas sp. psych-6C06]